MIGINYFHKKSPSQIFGRIINTPAANYIFKINNRKTRPRCEICFKVITKTLERRWRRSGVFIANFEHIPHPVLVFLLLTLSR